MTAARLFFNEKNLYVYVTMCNLLLNGIGMVCPRSGEFFAIEASHSDAATDQAFLDEADKSISLTHGVLQPLAIAQHRCRLICLESS